MDDLNIIRVIHILVRCTCFIWGAFILYPILERAKKRANGYKRARQYIQGAMLSIALIMVTIIGNQYVRLDEGTYPSTVFFWLESGMTIAIVGLTYFGVKMFAFKPPKDE